MRRSIWTRVLAVLLIISLLAAPVSAAGIHGYGANGWGVGGLIDFIWDIIRDIIDDLINPGEPEPTEPIETTPPTVPEETTVPTEPVETEPEVTEPEETEPEETQPEETQPEETEPEEGPETVLNLVEGHANTENGQLLRGVTYTLSTLVAQEEQSVTAPYALRSSSLSTLSLNSATLLAADTSETTVSDTALEITTDDLGAVIPNGQYVIRCVVAYANGSDSSYLTNQKNESSPWNTTVLLGTTTKADATYFTFARQSDGTYTIQDSDGNYLNVERNASNIDTAANYFTVEVKDDGIWLRDTDSGDCINALGADYYSEFYFGGWTDGSPLELYAVTTTTETPDVPVEPEQPETEAELIYFPVTMFNYDQDTINALTDAMDDDTTIREGFYFSDGGTEVPNQFTTQTDMSAFVAGQYYIQNVRADLNSVNSWLQAYPDESKIYGVAQENATVWTLSFEDGEAYLSCTIGGETHYMVVGTDGATDGYSTTKTPVTLSAVTLTDDGYVGSAKIGQDGYYLCQWGSETALDYGGYNGVNDPGNAMKFYPVVDGTVSDTPVVPTSTSVLTSGYQIWNRWAYSSSNNSAQNMFYGGLVEEQLNENNEIVFTVNEPGIFTFDAEAPTVTNDGKKDIYQHVGLPFVKNEKGYYTFDSDAHGTYFADTTGDGNSDPWYGTSDNYFNMYFDYQQMQGWSGMSDQFGDKSSNLWAPYNTNENDTGAGAIDYHFGMRADIPFSMTSNGRIKSNDDNSEPITFTFAGDDDVWIFIDGNLVIDLGGIHNRIGATIDFANNTITYFIPESNKSDTADYPLGCHSNRDSYPLNEDGTITVKLYDDADGEGALGQTRLDFSAEEEHEMSIFYLERGEGTSNCKIEFNLPMRDTLLITKDATKSWSEAQDEADGDEGDGTISLTAREQASVNNMSFGFTLYKKTAEETAFTAVANTNFYVQDADGNVLAIQSTDASGKFYLKNGQTAKFMTDFPKEGVTYYVVEDTVPEGFLTPDFQYDGVSTDGMDWYDSTVEEPSVTHVKLGSEIPEQELALDATENKSYIVTAYGSIESIDSLEFICVNYLDETLPNPTAIGNEDIIVIDYGLPVNIDPLANDLFRGDTVEIVAWGDESLVLNEVLDAYGNAVTHDDENAETKTSWSGTQNFHSGTVAFNDVDYTEVIAADDQISYTGDTFTYTLTEQLTEVEVISYIIRVDSKVETNITGTTKTASRYALAKVYIVPATIMYYEENFSDLVTFTGSNWGGTVTTDGASKYQEPGVVGTIDDSTYGSDVAYLNDSYDSNGTSKYADTTNGAVRFTYTFTGTGTSIFARTSDTTGYVQIKLYEGTDTSSETGVMVNITYRDTYWKDENNTDLDSDGTLYNIPIYTEDGLEYGTYTVVATVAKAGTATEGNVNGSGKDFWLDGIRIMQPLNVENETVIDEETGETITDLALGAYATDGESNLDVVTLRQKLITDAEDGVAIWDGTNFVVLTDIDGAIITAEDYTSIGPKEEVYLAPGQKVSFSLKYWQPEGLKLYMGMKAPFGSASLNVGNSAYSLRNATDCYYDVTDNYASLVEMTDEDGYPYYVVTYTFEATDSIVSLTNIKVVGNYEFTIVENTDIEVPGDEGGDVVVDGSEG